MGVLAEHFELAGLAEHFELAGGNRPNGPNILNLRMPRRTGIDGSTASSTLSINLGHIEHKS